PDVTQGGNRHMICFALVVSVAHRRRVAPNFSPNTMKANATRIVLTSLDFDRLEALLDSLPANAFPGKATLETELRRAEIVAPEKIPPNVVTMNSTVRFTIAESGEDFRLTLV